MNVFPIKVPRLSDRKETPLISIEDSEKQAVALAPPTPRRARLGCGNSRHRPHSALPQDETIRTGLIALDATYSLDPWPTGVAIYSREILYGLAKAHPETEFAFCYRPHRFRASLNAELPRNARRRILAPGFGLFHGLNQRLPRWWSGPRVATFHDLFVITGEYSTHEFRARFAAQARDAAARADFIIAVSAFTRAQVISRLGADPARVRVIHHGVRALRAPRGIAREKVILSAGAIQTRKNIARLVEAFEAIDREWRLVLIGSDGYGAESIHKRIASSPARQRISVLGYVSAEELAAWYARAEIFAFPSLDEGFGMPILEAMTAGAAVVTSNRSATAEVAGDAALLIDPDESEELIVALRRLTKDAGLRSELASRGVRRASQFTWEKAVAETWNAYRELLDERG
jgi:glycosyltransferase involved in cell wall biosynthesis